jgi:hypothetical protein
VNDARLIVALALILTCQGCIVAPLQVAAALDVSIIDADSGAPIGGANVVYFVCDIHDFACDRGRLVRTTASSSGKVKIPGQRQWGLWIAAPGGLPVPNHFIAIWAPGYSPFVFSQYDDSLERVITRIGATRPDVAEELKAFPANLSSDPTLNSRRQLNGGKIRLRKSVAQLGTAAAFDPHFCYS